MEDMNLVPLSPFDNVMARFYAKFIFFFRLQQDQNIRTVHGILEKGLRMTLCDIPVFAGKVYFIRPDDRNSTVGRLEIRYPAIQSPGSIPELVFKDYTDDIDYDDLINKGVPQDELDGEKLLPTSSAPDLATGADVLVLQANYVDGGVLLGVAIFHSATDATGSTTFLRLWANNCSRVQDENAVSESALHLSPGSLDYSSLREYISTSEKEPLCAPQENWRLLGLCPLRLDRETLSLATMLRTTPKKKMTTSIFYFSPKSFLQLKKDGSMSGSSRLISSNDVLMGLLWRAIMRARIAAAAPPRDHIEHVEATLDTTLDARPLFPGLSSDYVGSLILINTTRMPLSVLTDPSTPLAQVSVEVRATVDEITQERARRALSLADIIPDYTKVTHPFASFDGDEVCITSLIQLTWFELNWGKMFDNGGRIESLRPTRRELDAVFRRCMVLPMRQNGGFEVLVSLFEEEMQHLEKDQEFNRYAMFACR